MFRASVGGGAAMSTHYRHPLLAAMSGLLAVLPARRARCWSTRSLALAALLMSWDDGPALLDRFMAARALLGRRCGGTYQGFAKALARHGTKLVGTLRRHLAGLIRGHHDLWTIEGWMLFAIDASRFDLPRTLDNDTALGTPTRRGSLPQLLATMLVHLGSGIVWDWRLTHCNAGERRGMLAMLASLPKGALLVADAGFVGHECLSAVVKSGRHVLVRLAGNAVLTTGLTRRSDVVALWPRWKRQSGPLLLRVVRVKDRKGGEVVLGTSVLDKKLLSDAQAGVFYRLRWGVEVCYRSLKQTLRRRKLLSASPARAVRELHWVLLGAMALGLLTLTRLNPRLDRRRWSVAAAARAVRHAARARTGAVAHRHLSTLRIAVCSDNRRTNKQAWEWPHKKKQRPPGPPVLRPATRAEVSLWRSLSDQRV
jgi:hypothetical protein